MRKMRVYAKFFWPLLALVGISLLCYIYLPQSLNSFQTGLLSTALGVGISIAGAEGIKKLTEYKRMKKVAGLLKLVTIQYLENQCLNFKENSKLYKDMGDFEHARAFLLLVKNYDKVSSAFDKQWFQLIYSAHFIDIVDADSQLNAIGHAISEVLIFNKTITWHSLNASRLLAREERMRADETFDKDDVAHFILQARRVRDDIDECIEKLDKYTHELNGELNRIFVKTGVSYEEFQR
jgi:hypothetical protein